MESCKSYSSNIKPTKTPDSHILWMFVILKEYAIICNNWVIWSNQLYTVKIKVCNTLLIYKKTIKETENSKILKNN